MRNYFQGTKESPHHISIGAVVRNDKGEICCHYFESLSHPTLGVSSNFYLLMRESIEPNESIEFCLHRGLMEEFGIKAELNSYLGSIVSHFPMDEVTIEKTTLYFLCDFISTDESKRKTDDAEGLSTLVWLPVAKLISLMKEQGKRLGREDVDESKVLESLVSEPFSVE